MNKGSRELIKQVITRLLFAMYLTIFIAVSVAIVSVFALASSQKVNPEVDYKYREVVQKYRELVKKQSMLIPPGIVDEEIIVSRKAAEDAMNNAERDMSGPTVIRNVLSISTPVLLITAVFFILAMSMFFAMKLCIQPITDLLNSIASTSKEK